MRIASWYLNDVSIRVHTIFQVSSPWWWAAAAPVMLSVSLCWVCSSPSPCWPPSSCRTSQSPPPAPMWRTHPPPSPPPAPPTYTLPSPGSMSSLTQVTRTGSLTRSQNRSGSLCRKCSIFHLNNIFFRNLMCLLMVSFTMLSRPACSPWPLLASILSQTSFWWLDHVANSGGYWSQGHARCFHHHVFSKAVSCCPGWLSACWSWLQLQSQLQFSFLCLASTCTSRWIKVL